MNRIPANQNIPDSSWENQVYETDTLSGILASSLGSYVICEFLIGTTLLERREGILYQSGVNFFTLYQREEDRYLVCDLYSLKFIYFYDVVNNNHQNNNMGYKSVGPNMRMGQNM